MTRIRFKFSVRDFPRFASAFRKCLRRLPEADRHLVSNGFSFFSEYLFVSVVLAEGESFSFDPRSDLYQFRFSNDLKTFTFFEIPFPRCCISSVSAS